MFSLISRHTCESRTTNFNNDDIHAETKEQIEVVDSREIRVASQVNPYDQASAGWMPLETVLTPEAIAHDMKTPLTVLQLSREVLEKHPEIAKNNPEIIKRIAWAERTLNQLAENAAMFGLIQDGEPITVRPVVTNLTELSQNLVELHQPLAERREINLTMTFIETELVATVDPILLERAITNLLTNALNWTPAGGCVSFQLERVNDAAELRVSDTGPGIKPEDLPNVFKRFWRSDMSENIVPGSGLGLAIASAVVAAHHGTLSVESKKEDGADFVIRLPV